jgi:hypothetical protein
MRTLTTSTCLLLALAAAAQAQDAGEPRASSAAAPAQSGRAPLATPDDLEPKVDVGGKRVAMLTPPATPAAPAPPSGTLAVPDPDANATPDAPASVSKRAARKSKAPAPPGVAAPAAASSAQRAPEPNSRALDTLDLGTTSITGNQELPKVLYIVPWKKSDLGDLVGRPVNTLLDEVLEPVDPEVFERHLNYYEGLYGKGRKEKE